MRLIVEEASQGRPRHDLVALCVGLLILALCARGTPAHAIEDIGESGHMTIPIEVWTPGRAPSSYTNVGALAGDVAVAAECLPSVDATASYSRPPNIPYTDEYADLVVSVTCPDDPLVHLWAVALVADHGVHPLGSTLSTFEEYDGNAATAELRAFQRVPVTEILKDAREAPAVHGAGSDLQWRFKVVATYTSGAVATTCLGARALQGFAPGPDLNSACLTEDELTD